MKPYGHHPTPRRTRARAAAPPLRPDGSAAPAARAQHFRSRRPLLSRPSPHWSGVASSEKLAAAATLG
eukprot:scaffold47310_cov66-Phaeocystis_antarctica.AAC.3